MSAYTAAVENGISTTTVTATANHAGASVSIAPGAEVSLAEGENEIAVTATAEDGLTTRTYTVAVTRAASSDDATLSALSLSGINIGTFSSTVTAYTAEVGNGVAATTVTATPSHSAASVSIAPGSEVSLAEGENEITVTVTAQDGLTTQAYTVTVTRAVPPVISIEAVSSPYRKGAGAVSGERAWVRSRVRAVRGISARASGHCDAFSLGAELWALLAVTTRVETMWRSPGQSR